jgi:hypothetical protein
MPNHQHRQIPASAINGHLPAATARSGLKPIGRHSNYATSSRLSASRLQLPARDECDCAAGLVGDALVAESRARATACRTCAIPMQHARVASGSLWRLRWPPSRSDLGDCRSGSVFARPSILRKHGKIVRRHGGDPRLTWRPRSRLSLPLGEAAVCPRRPRRRSRVVQSGHLVRVKRGDCVRDDAEVSFGEGGLAASSCNAYASDRLAPAALAHSSFVYLASVGQPE